jgi:thiosulfate dehydrogenase [quinone] large subunit
LVVVGVVQILMGFALIIGFYTRVVAGLLGLMAVVTIILTGIILLSGIIHFAYAFATLGGAIVLFIHGSGAYSMDEMIRSESPAG